MNFKKLGLALVISASFGLMACGDDSSSSSDNDGSLLVSCKSESTDNSFKSVTKSGDKEATVDITIDENGILKTIVTSPIESDEDKAECEYADEEEDEEYSLVCKDGIMTITMSSAIPAFGNDKEELIKKALETASEEYEEQCKLVNGKTRDEVENLLKDRYDDEDGDVDCDED